MTMLAFTRVALLRLLRDRTNAFFMLLFPLLIILLVGVQFGGGAPVPRVGVTPPDADVLDLRAGDLTLEVVAYDTAAQARQAVEDGDVDAAVALPATSVDPAGDQTGVVEFIANPDGSDIALRSVVAAAVGASNADQQAVRALLASTDVEPSVAAEMVQSIGATGPQLRTTTVGGGGLAEEFAGLGQFDLGASTQLLLFVFITTMAGAVGVVQARRLRILDRVLTGPTAPGTVIGGLALAQLAVAGTQALLIVVTTSLLFGVAWGDPLAATAVVVLFCAVAAAAGLLLGAAASAEEQVNGMAVPVSLALGAVGGSMVPLEVFPATLQTVARATPHAWGNLAFAEVVRRGGGITDVLPELAVLLGFAVVLGALATVVLQRRLGTG